MHGLRIWAQLLHLIPTLLYQGPNSDCRGWLTTSIPPCYNFITPANNSSGAVASAAVGAISAGCAAGVNIATLSLRKSLSSLYLLPPTFPDIRRDKCLSTIITLCSLLYGPMSPSLICCGFVAGVSAASTPTNSSSYWYGTRPQPARFAAHGEWHFQRECLVMHRRRGRSRITTILCAATPRLRLLLVPARLLGGAIELWNAIRSAGYS